MAQWRYRSPGDFPPGFHEALLLGDARDKVAGRYMTLGGAREAQVQFRLFRFCIRNTPSSKLYDLEANSIHRTRIAWLEEDKRWGLLLTSKRPSSSGLLNPEDLR